MKYDAVTLLMWYRIKYEYSGTKSVVKYCVDDWRNYLYLNDYVSNKQNINTQSQIKY